MNLVVIGSGGHGRVLIATARAAGRNVVQVLDDNPDRIGKQFCGLIVEGPVREVISRSRNVEAVIGIGDNRARSAIAQAIDVPFATIVHPFSWLAPDTSLGEGTVVFAGTVVQPNVCVGRHCVLNTSCSVDHDCQLDDYSQIAPGAHIAGTVRVGEGAFVGIGASVNQMLEIGPWATVGAGGAVIRSVAPGTTAWGVPAKSRTEQ